MADQLMAVGEGVHSSLAYSDCPVTAWVASKAAEGRNQLKAAEVPKVVGKWQVLVAALLG